MFFQKAILSVLLICSFFLVLPVEGFATPSVLDIGQAIDAKNQRRQQQNDRVREESLQSRERVSFEVPASQLCLPKNETPCYAISSIQLQNYNPTRPADYLSILQGALKKLHVHLPHCFGENGLNLLLKQIQNQFIEKGFVTTKIVLESNQNLLSGELVLTVVQGRVGKILVSDTSNPKRFTSLTAKTAFAVQSGTLLNIRDIEQTLENLQRLPTVKTNMEILPSQKIGESDIQIHYKQNVPLRFSFGVDDSGSRTTGRYQCFASASIDNLFTANDIFSTTFTRSMKTGGDEKGQRGTKNISFHYSIPFGYWQFNFNASRYRYHQEVFGVFQNYMYSGESLSQKADLSYVLYRDNKRKTTLRGGVWQRCSDSYIDEEKIDVQHRRTAGWQAGIHHREYQPFATLDLDVSYKRGTGAFGSQPAPEELFNEGTSRAGIIFASLSAFAPFQLKQQNFYSQLRVNGQWNCTPLTPQDRFAIGGRYSVRGFDGELSLSGNRGLTIQYDLGYFFLPNHQVCLGLDYGKVAEQPLESFGDELIGAAVAFKGRFWHFNYDVFVGKPIRKPQWFKTANHTAGFHFSVQF